MEQTDPAKGRAGWPLPELSSQEKDEEAVNPATLRLNDNAGTPVLYTAR